MKSFEEDRDIDRFLKKGTEVYRKDFAL